MKKYISLLMLILVVSVISCNSTRNTVVKFEDSVALSSLEQRQIDSLLQWGLEHEALYTLWANIKSISSLSSYTLLNLDSIKKPGTTFRIAGSKSGGVDGLCDFQKIVNRLNQLNIPDLTFVFVPNSWGDDMRFVQLTVARRSVLNKVLEKKSSFFGPLGLVPGAEPHVVVSVIENLPRDERHRGYGYLFGFPDYAIDFFIKAGIKKEETGEFVERNFFRIPVYDGIGSFVYAYPKDYTPTIETDSILYYKSEKVLNDYKAIRGKYLRNDSTLRADDLLKDLQIKSVE